MQLPENLNLKALIGIGAIGILLILGLTWLPKGPSPLGPDNQNTPGLPSQPPILDEEPLDSSNQPSAQVTTNSEELAKLQKLIPYTNDHFRVEFQPMNNTIEVLFLTRLTKSTPEALEQYHQQLRAYQEEFLRWLSDNKVNKELLAIVYFPNPE